MMTSAETADISMTWIMTDHDMNQAPWHPGTLMQR